ncbi:MAG: hypothetical protein HYX52_04375 [Chloroflexi bacterium]|nr:hypothetical protein [Chloroflexota bacterium]
MGALSTLGRRFTAGGQGLAYYPVGGTCCLPELAGGEPEAFEQAGWTRAASPRHADLLLVTGPVNGKLAPVVARLYQQVPAPRRAVLVGGCAHAPYADGASAAAALFGEARRVPGCPVDPAAVVSAAGEDAPP